MGLSARELGYRGIGGLCLGGIGVVLMNPCNISYSLLSCMITQCLKLCLVASESVNSQHLWVPAQDPHLVCPLVSLHRLHPFPRSYWQCMVAAGGAVIFCSGPAIGKGSIL